MSNEDLEKCRQQVLWGLEEGAIDAVIRPVRNLLSRCRVNLHLFGIEIASLYEELAQWFLAWLRPHTSAL